MLHSAADPTPDSLILETFTSHLAHTPSTRVNCLLAHRSPRYPGTITVYQAFKPVIATYFATHGYLTGCKEFSMDRMTWVKPGFLWMMHRSGWASKKDQEHVLAIHVQHNTFIDWMRVGILSSHKPARSPSGEEEDIEHRAEWKRQLENSDVRVQWDPDHEPAHGHPLARRVIQIGLRGEAVRQYADKESGVVVAVEDITTFAKRERERLQSGARIEELQVPVEREIEVGDEEIFKKHRLSNN